LVVPGVRRPRSELVSGGFGMVVCRAFVLGFLEQESGGSWRSRLPFCNDRDRHHHSIHAGRLGRGCRLPGNERQRGFPDEGCGSARGVVLLGQAGSSERCASRSRTERAAGGWRTPRLGRGGVGSQVGMIPCEEDAVMSAPVIIV